MSALHQPHRMVGPKRGERGMALIITLGFLCVVCIAVLSLALVSRRSRQTASSAADGVRSKLLVSSAVDRAIEQLKEDFEGDIFPGDAFTVGAEDSAWEGRRFLVSESDTNKQDLEEAIHVALNGLTFTPEDYTACLNIDLPNNLIITLF